MTCFFVDRFESRMTARFLGESEKGMLWEPRIIESRRKQWKVSRKLKRERVFFCVVFFVVVIIVFVLIFGHPCFYVICASIEFFCEAGHFTKRSGFLELCIIHEKLMIYRVVSYIRERCSVQDEENRPQYWALRHTLYMSCDVDEDELLTEVDWHLSERYDWNHWSAVDWMPKTVFRWDRRIWWSIVSKAAERSNKRRTEMLLLSRVERISSTTCNKTVSGLCPAR